MKTELKSKGMDGKTIATGKLIEDVMDKNIREYVSFQITENIIDKFIDYQSIFLKVNLL